MPIWCDQYIPDVKKTKYRIASGLQGMDTKYKIIISNVSIRTVDFYGEEVFDESNLRCWLCHGQNDDYHDGTDDGADEALEKDDEGLRFLVVVPEEGDEGQEAEGEGPGAAHHHHVVVATVHL